MRQRIVRVAVAAVLIALLLFAVPLAVVIRTALFDDERRELERTALQAAVRIDPDFAHDDPVELPPNEQQVGVYEVSLELRFGPGPKPETPLFNAPPPARSPTARLVAS